MAVRVQLNLFRVHSESRRGGLVLVLLLGSSGWRAFGVVGMEGQRHFQRLMFGDGYGSEVQLTKRPRKFKDFFSNYTLSRLEKRERKKEEEKESRGENGNETSKLAKVSVA
ncbi:hypothetical protein B0T26DRAFT_357172 [Lasiosphaeria miniovina]|uniref:Uncharacterized protein n=1 Tax=Lasiosphaeria miniovina TaxID=1954250 RepID=A0AA40AC31_9PEZI|nr:uncharacterized protein B0T26DRAFT_357172 [Lasiosphaeria miniovina]KAK0713131.1 hypothetical protein B0T26DRAFT_357172 [Lasiosphaeria miniovina]